MPNARQNILDYILEQQSTTVEELSKVFQVTPANIRHHLSILIRQGSVKVTGYKNQTERGRPAQVYSATQQINRNNLDHLADALISSLQYLTGPGEINNLLKEVASRLGTEFKIPLTNPTRLLYSTIQSLNYMNYQAHWEAHIDNPRIMLGHCPYRAILDKHPELCRLDALLLEHLLDTPVRQTEKLTLDIKGHPRCVFLVQKPAS